MVGVTQQPLSEVQPAAPRPNPTSQSPSQTGKSPVPPSLQAYHQRLSQHLMSLLRSHAPPTPSNPALASTSASESASTSASSSSLPIPATNPNRRSSLTSPASVRKNSDTSATASTATRSAASLSTSASASASASASGRSGSLSTKISSVSSESSKGVAAVMVPTHPKPSADQLQQPSALAQLVETDENAMSPSTELYTETDPETHTADQDQPASSVVSPGPGSSHNPDGDHLDVEDGMDGVDVPLMTARPELAPRLSSVMLPHMTPSPPVSGITTPAIPQSQFRPAASTPPIPIRSPTGRPQANAHPHPNPRSPVVPSPARTREEEHRAAWRADGRKVWKNIPQDFQLKLDSIPRRRAANETRRLSETDAERPILPALGGSFGMDMDNRLGIDLSEDFVAKLGLSLPERPASAMDSRNGNDSVAAPSVTDHATIDVSMSSAPSAPSLPSASIRSTSVSPQMATSSSAVAISKNLLPKPPRKKEERAPPLRPVEIEGDEEYEARRQLRLKRKQAELVSKIGRWWGDVVASGATEVAEEPLEILPNIPSPRLAAASLRGSPGGSTFHLPPIPGLTVIDSRTTLHHPHPQLPRNAPGPEGIISLSKHAQVFPTAAAVTLTSNTADSGILSSSGASGASAATALGMIARPTSAPVIRPTRFDAELAAKLKALEAMLRPDQLAPALPGLPGLANGESSYHHEPPPIEIDGAWRTVEGAVRDKGATRAEKGGAEAEAATVRRRAEAGAADAPAADEFGATKSGR